MTTILFALSLLVAAFAVVRLIGVLRARNKQRVLAMMRGARCDAPDTIGVSVLCSGTTDPAQLENLLAVEYARYEVVVVVDAMRHPELFAQWVSRYRMIRVEWNVAGELDVAGIRAVGRSRKRCFRRLVLVDREGGDRVGDYNAGAAVAAYDFLIPLASGVRLLPGAIERLVTELGEVACGAWDWQSAGFGRAHVVVRREAVVAAGGFGSRVRRQIPASRRRVSWMPLLVTPGLHRRRMWRLGGMSLVLALFAVAAAVVGWWGAAACLSAGLFAISAELYLQQEVNTACERSEDSEFVNRFLA